MRASGSSATSQRTPPSRIQFGIMRAPAVSSKKSKIRSRATNA